MVWVDGVPTSPTFNARGPAQAYATAIAAGERRPEFSDEMLMLDDRSPKLEAYGVKGVKSRPWSRTFRNADHLARWCEENDAEVQGTREVD